MATSSSRRSSPTCPTTAKVVTDEIFGPAVVVLPFKDEAEVIARANAVRYGLAGSVWTTNVQRAMRMSAALEFGTVWVNDHLPITAEMPHGGFKQSGFGKDMSLYALDDYTPDQACDARDRGRAAQGVALHHLRRSRLSNWACTRS